MPLVADCILGIIKLLTWLAIADIHGGEFMKSGFIKRLFLPPTALLLLLLLSSQARAHIYLVTDTNDTTEVTSLRGAVIAANHAGGNNMIVLGYEKLRRGMRIHPPSQPWVYQLTIPGANEEAARMGDLNITRGDLTILGVGSNVTISATSLGDRVFHVLPRARLTLQDLTVTGGVGDWDPSVVGGVGSGDGGGIYNAGALTMVNCTITNNSAGFGPYSDFAWTGGAGGGIYNAGTASLNHCIITANSSGTGGWVGQFYFGPQGGDGGGVYNSGMMILNDCMVSRNSTDSGTDGSAGGRGVAAVASATSGK
jgi:hypothetical protein